MYRYVVCVESTGERDVGGVIHRVRQAIARAPSTWSLVLDASGLLVAHAGARNTSPRAYRLAEGAGVILGTLFGRTFHTNPRTTRRDSFDADESRRIADSRGRHLVTTYWGSYVAVLRDRSLSECVILRDPTGTLPCFRTSLGSCHVFTSNIADADELLSLDVSVNRSYLAKWFILNGVATRQTALQNVEDIRGGEAIALRAGREIRSVVWNPVEFCRTRYRLSRDQQGSLLRSSIQDTVDAWSSCHESIVLKLSGGLDSSIVAACLSRTPSAPRLTLLNFSINMSVENRNLPIPGLNARDSSRLRSIAGHGDERYYARLVADRFKIPLVERQRSIVTDLSKMWDAPLRTNPGQYVAAIDTEADEIDLAHQVGATAFFSGHGGDSTLLATTQPFPAIDAGYSRSLRTGIWQHVEASSRLSRISHWASLALFFKHGVFRRPLPSPVTFLSLPSFLDDEVTAELRETDFHGHWEDSASGLPPGKRSHLSGLLGEPFYDSAFRRLDLSDQVDIFNCQLVWECALQIATYDLLVGGVSRGLARLAFGDLLPREVTQRQSKATGTPFYHQLIRANWAQLRDLLLDGQLVTDRILNRRKLMDYFEADEPFLSPDSPPVLAYASAEVWARQWRARKNIRAPHLRDQLAVQS